METRTLHPGLLLVLCIALPLIIGIIGSVVTLGSLPGWYAGLNKPPCTPPAWLFGPVWTVLYILMGVSLFLILRNGTNVPFVWQGVTLFAAQLAFNLLWSIVFFGWHAIAAALAVLLLLIVFIAATLWTFRRISVTAAWLLVPYIAWCCIATVLNASLMLLN